MSLELESGPAALASYQPSRAVRLAMLVFIVLQGLDLLTTLTVFSHGGIELNPVLTGVMPWTGRLIAVLASKVFLIALVIPLSRRKRILYFADVLYSGIVMWNLLIVFVLKQV